MRPIGELGVPRSHPDYMKLYYAKNREKFRQRHKKYREANREVCNARSTASHLKRQKAEPEVYAARNAARLAAKLERTPKWADKKAIAEFYEEARRLTEETGVEHDVDHIIPLRGKLVSGLHVENNLQVITASENRKKKNNYRIG